LAQFLASTRRLAIQIVAFSFAQLSSPSFIVYLHCHQPNHHQEHQLFWVLFVLALHASYSKYLSLSNEKKEMKDTDGRIYLIL